MYVCILFSFFLYLIWIDLRKYILWWLHLLLLSKSNRKLIDKKKKKERIIEQQPKNKIKNKKMPFVGTSHV